MRFPFSPIRFCTVSSLLLFASDEATGGKRIAPLHRHGVACASMGCLIDAGAPLVWRGPLVMGAVRQLCFDVRWPDAMDVLVMDLPPGTGDAQLSLAQVGAVWQAVVVAVRGVFFSCSAVFSNFRDRVGVSWAFFRIFQQNVFIDGAVIVSTPQTLALDDVRRAVNMMRRTHIPILGVVQNMSVFECPSCHHETHLFGSDGARRFADEFDLPLLGNVPLRVEIRQQSDAGCPVTARDDTEGQRASQPFYDIARNVWSALQARRAGAQ